MENSHIEWTDNTFNPWIGCTKVSPGCEHCYAEARDQRFAQGKHWGKGAPRQRTSVANWRQPIKWTKEAEQNLECLTCGATTDFGVNADGFCEQCEHHAEIIRPRVFCASLADWLDDEVPIEWLADLMHVVKDTPNLNWQLLTKRPQNFNPRMTEVLKYLEDKGANPREFDLWKWILDWVATDDRQRTPGNVWIGTTVEDQQRAKERIPLLLKIPARVRFLSCEPLLSDLGLVGLMPGVMISNGNYARQTFFAPGLPPHDEPVPLGIHWVICGGESGPDARPMHPDWAYGLRDQCQAAGVAFFFKQWGEWWPEAANGFTQWPDIDRKRPLLMPAHPGREGVDQHQVMQCRGKHRTGRLLDGREWSEFPKVEVPA